MKLGLWKRREVWWPTWRGWLAILVVCAGVPGWWWFRGEEFLSVTKRVDPDVLVVEGWIGEAALHDAALEFHRDGYRLVVAAGLPAEEPAPDGEPWDYAEVAAAAMWRAGINRELVVEAPGNDALRHRTYETALGVQRGLSGRREPVRTLTVFTKGAHARRSLRVFEDVFGPETEVGVIAWEPEWHEGKSWRSSSGRAKSFVQESLGYVHEVLMGGGR